MLVFVQLSKVILAPVGTPCCLLKLPVLLAVPAILCPVHTAPIWYKNADLHLRFSETIRTTRTKTHKNAQKQKFTKTPFKVEIYKYPVSRFLFLNTLFPLSVFSMFRAAYSFFLVLFSPVLKVYVD